MLMILVFTQSTGCVAKHATVPDAMAQLKCSRRSLAKPACKARPGVTGAGRNVQQVSSAKMILWNWVEGG